MVLRGRGAKKRFFGGTCSRVTGRVPPPHNAHCPIFFCFAIAYYFFLQANAVCSMPLLGQLLSWIALCIAACSKNITERPKKFPLRRPICDGKDDVGERSAKVVFQSPPQINRSAVRIIRDMTTAPCAEN